MSWNKTTEISDDPTEFLRCSCEESAPEGTTDSVLELALLESGTAYAAVERTGPSGERVSVRGMVCVCLIEEDDEPDEDDETDDPSLNWIVMDERSGPVAAECPQDLLELMTPPSNHLAAGWRRECWKYHENKSALEMSDGDLIRLDDTVLTRTPHDGREHSVDTFKVVEFEDDFLFEAISNETHEVVAVCEIPSIYGMNYIKITDDEINKRDAASRHFDETYETRFGVVERIFPLRAEEIPDYRNRCPSPG